MFPGTKKYSYADMAAVSLWVIINCLVQMWDRWACTKENMNCIVITTTRVWLNEARKSWWRHQWKHFSRYWPFGGEFTGPRWIPLTKTSDAELWCFLWSAPEQTRLSKQWCGPWLETPSGSLWRHSNVTVIDDITTTKLHNESYIWCVYIDGLVQDCSITNVLAMEIL